mmetsp:Transcript_3055/g.7168  ORF Transcript_3055/g.7168 Transcript_3055/m.7168 type:complete len:727 (-) Transcript_3055:26-2206(-)
MGNAALNCLRQSRTAVKSVISSPSFFPPSALFEAAQVGDLESVKKFVRLDFPVDIEDKDGRTPLHVACQYGQLEVVDFLVCSGARLDTVDQKMMTPLLSAAVEGHAEVVKLLLKKGAQPDAVQKRGNSALHTVLRESSRPFEIGVILLEHGADPIASNDVGETPLHCASYNPDGAKAIGLLLSRSNRPADLIVNTVSRGRVTPLHIASAYASVSSVLRLINAGANVQALTENGTGALHFAAASLSIGRCEVIEELLRHSLDDAWINAPNDRGKTPLHCAAERGQHCVLELLIARGADIRATDKNGRSALHAACASRLRGRRMVVEELLSAGLNPHEPDFQGRSPLHHAATGGNAAVVLDLLRCRASPTKASRAGQMPLHLAAAHGRREAAKHLIEAEPSAVSARDASGKAPLHLAVETGHNDVVEVLVDAGASVMQLDDDGRTALHNAAMQSSDEAVRLLRRRPSAGEALTLLDSSGLAPLHHAVLQGHVGTIQELLSLGASVDLRTGAGESADQLAERCDRSSVADMLRDHCNPGADTQASTSSHDHSSRQPPPVSSSGFGRSVTAPSAASPSAPSLSPVSRSSHERKVTWKRDALGPGGEPGGLHAANGAPSPREAGLWPPSLRAEPSLGVAGSTRGSLDEPFVQRKADTGGETQENTPPRRLEPISRNDTTRSSGAMAGAAEEVHPEPPRRDPLPLLDPPPELSPPRNRPAIPVPELLESLTR